MKRVLVVDDVPAVLRGLEKLFRGERARWTASFAGSGEEALAILAKTPADLIVTDMRMPGMDGLELLRQVRDRHPHLIRIVLTGYADTAVMAQASAIAHRWALKPCPWEDLRGLLERSFALQDLLASEPLRRAVGGLGTLPSAPRTYQALTEALSDPDAKLDRIAAIVEQDVGMSSRVLQFVNSAFFGFAQRVTSIEAAIVRLGLNTLRHLALTFEVFSAFGGGPEAEGFSLAALQRHALLTARLARKIVASPAEADAAFAAGLLHVAGTLVLMNRLPDRFAAAVAQARERGRPLHVAEKELIGADHAELGAYLLGIWGLPHGIIEPVGFHHAPDRLTSRSGPLAAVSLADLLAHEAMPLGPPGLAAAGAEELALLDRQPRVEDWRRLAAEQAAALAGE